MSSVDAPARSLQDWLDALITAPHAQLLTIANQALHDARCATSPVRCTRCGPNDRPMTFVAAVRHLTQTELAYRDTHPETRHPGGGQLHQAGDLVPTGPTQPPLDWATEPCRWCRRPVIWAQTITGTPIPIDPDPDPAGQIVLSIPPGGSYADRALATFLRSEAAEHLNTNPSTLRTRHASTCPNWRIR